MKKTKFNKKLKLKKISVANLNKIEGGALGGGGDSRIICTTTDPTAMTWCYHCPVEDIEIAVFKG